jgi:hypothetical protein
MTNHYLTSGAKDYDTTGDNGQNLVATFNNITDPVNISMGYAEFALGWADSGHTGGTLYFTEVDYLKSKATTEHRKIEIGDGFTWTTILDTTGNTSSVNFPLNLATVSGDTVFKFSVDDPSVGKHRTWKIEGYETDDSPYSGACYVVTY